MIRKCPVVGDYWHEERLVVFTKHQLRSDPGAHFLFSISDDDGYDSQFDFKIRDLYFTMGAKPYYARGE